MFMSKQVDERRYKIGNHDCIHCYANSQKIKDAKSLKWNLKALSGGISLIVLSWCNSISPQWSVVNTTNIINANSPHAVPTIVLQTVCIIHNSNFTCRVGVGLTSTLPQILAKLIGPDFGGPLQTSLHYTANYRHCFRRERCLFDDK